ncbi:MAG: hydroxyectoine utilization dehydratase EutB [Hoeflea sp.]|uniref:hydroxyectoine utilization dehydratase EutB n=1 Tax=Hoeflea sp. TaxID=1940281 RepID=UPI001D9090F1|nr:hydroxyectoine utilization dehydratase EutB [Hoeflea sp.]MBU4531294.1 hydroxyectoine utilization dehydratase EutB [Alphaproteobacteria bacterium]MBU4544151.1 hydroxyectoine utilization dehydratase EutB [Alphaproteobacteria bacterium]MBU4550612.1 hydroxyectoine utilization dehydratase EutB [Alphaproteobacteria bacterium]MBV1724571.1 hydroxyectoine utilization dehydratase EutB [Hoeflea sp.]MBV1760591.1 hydroxyectoine utilization dehydratase EutB [Hoeflea sp.]
MSTAHPFVDLGEIEQARMAIAGTVRLTPVNLSPSLSDLIGQPVHLKLEHTQITGSFKLRGATNAVASLSDDEKRRGVAGVSTGNHGRGLAYAAKAAGVKCIICMSKLVPQAKIDGIRAQGAEVRIIGSSQDEAQEEVARLVAENGMAMIPPFDHRAVIAGQGTLGLELLEQVPDLATVLVPLSGGGLISGVAAALKARRPDIRVIGISMERGAAMHECLKAGKPIYVEELATLADSLGGGIGLDNQLTFAMTRDLVDDIVLVSEAEIAAAIRHIYWQERQIVEGSGAVGVAALLTGRIRSAGPVAAILSGGNIDMTQHFRIISGEDVDVTREAA